MQNEHKAQALLAQMARGLLAHAQRNTKAQLGERASYVGMSDLGRAMQCMRAAVADKSTSGSGVSPEEVAEWFGDGDDQRVQSVLGRQLILQRGHWLETGIGKALSANGSQFIAQLEIETTLQQGESSIPLRAHLDFTLVRGGAQPAVRILELKSTGHLPKTLNPAYEMQVYGQLGLLASCWNQPCFNLRAEDGHVLFSGLTFPELAARLFRARLPESPEQVDIEGWVLCLSMSEAKPFGPYLPDEAMHSLALRLAGDLWDNHRKYANGLIRLGDLEYAKGFHPLCDWCDHAATCPKFSSGQVDSPEGDAALRQLEELKANRKSLEQEIRAMEERICRQYARWDAAGGWLSTGKYRFKVSNMPGRTTLNRGRLQAELTSMVGGEVCERILTRSTDRGNPYERLFVGRHPQAATKTQQENNHVASGA